jgi:hypothetical protein
MLAISKLIEREFTVKKAAISFMLSSRQNFSPKRRLREFGVGLLIHKNTGRRPYHKIGDSLKKR